MKDEFARDQIGDLWERVEKLDIGISVRDCPECKHMTLMKRGSDRTLWFTGPPPWKVFTCLTCGKTFTDGLVVLEEAPIEG